MCGGVPGAWTELRALLEEHARETGSARAKALLADFRAACARFACVVPEEQAAARRAKAVQAEPVAVAATA